MILCLILSVVLPAHFPVRTPGPGASLVSDLSEGNPQHSISGSSNQGDGAQDTFNASTCGSAEPSNVPPSSEDGFWKKLGRSLGSTVQLGPGIDQLGIHVHGIKMLVANCTSYFARILVYGKWVAFLAPGDSVYDNRYFETQDTQVPIAALFYADSSGTVYVGAAGRIFSISRANPITFSWQIAKYEIRPPVFGALRESLSGAALTNSKQHRVRFPREPVGGTVGIQVVNNTRYAATVVLNGSREARLVAGGTKYFSVHQIATQTGQMVGVSIQLNDGVRNAGTAERRFSIPSVGVYAWQFVVGPEDLR